jgi:signal transduction histidine kinase
MTERELKTADFQHKEDPAPLSLSARRHFLTVVFTLASLVSLLLILGALAAIWMTSEALQGEVAALQRSSREPMKAMFAVAQSSWDYYASPGDGTAYARFIESLSLLPNRNDSAAGQVASARDFLRKSRSAVTQRPSTQDAGREVATALKDWAGYSLSNFEQGDNAVLLSIERYQRSALQMTGWGLVLGVFVALAGLTYVRRIERINATQYDQLLADREKLKDLSSRLLAAQEQERKAVSRELHDDVGQALSVLAMDAARAASLTTLNDGQLRSIVANIRQTADQVLVSVRDLALGLRPSMLDDLGLPAALDWLSRETSRRGDVEVALRMEGLDKPLPERFKTCIYRVVQEGLRNASRHSGARNIAVEVVRLGQQVHIRIRDDGRGFDPRIKQGLGLLGAAERLSVLGGTLIIESSPGGGTSFVAELIVAEDA